MNVALDILSRIHTIPTVPIVDCFQKIRQQVKCYLQLAGVMGKNECMQVRIFQRRVPYRLEMRFQPHVIVLLPSLFWCQYDDILRKWKLILATLILTPEFFFNITGGGRWCYCSSEGKVNLHAHGAAYKTNSSSYFVKYFIGAIYGNWCEQTTATRSAPIQIIQIEFGLARSRHWADIWSRCKFTALSGGETE